MKIKNTLVLAAIAIVMVIGTYFFSATPAQCNQSSCFNAKCLTGAACAPGCACIGASPGQFGTCLSVSFLEEQ